jgi:hypothetical protein
MASVANQGAGGVSQIPFPRKLEIVRSIYTPLAPYIGVYTLLPANMESIGITRSNSKDAFIINACLKTKHKLLHTDISYLHIWEIKLDWGQHVVFWRKI